MEHLANDLPWRDKFFVDYIGTDQEGRLQMNDLENKLTKYKGKVKLVAVTGASNVTGYVNPIHEIARIAHRHGAEILVDGAQLVPHLPVNMKPADSPEHIDYLVFSAHKMYAPFGIGILIGPRKTFEKATPVYKGGGCVRLATRRFVQWDEPPAKDEAGSPNLMGIVALIAAIKSLQSIGMERIEQYESQLTDYAISRLKTITDLNLYTHCNPNEKKVSIIPFNIKGMPHELVTKILSIEDGIAVRNGLFCAHPYLGKLLNLTDSDLYNCLRDQNTNLPGMVRISFGLYNEYWEIDRLIKALTRITTHKNYYLNKYTFQNSCCR
jgi:cysteine desulfurase/selenocysteine lyase